MNTRERSELFVRYVGLELKGKITSRGFTAQAVAQLIARSPAAFNRWLNGKVEIPLTVLCEACEVIEVEPRSVVETAYDRMVYELGETDGTTYEDDDPIASVHQLSVVPPADTEDLHNVDISGEKMAASKDTKSVPPERGES